MICHINTNCHSEALDTVNYSESHSGMISSISQNETDTTWHLVTLNSVNEDWNYCWNHISRDHNPLRHTKHQIKSWNLLRFLGLRQYKIEWYVINWIQYDSLPDLMSTTTVGTGVTGPPNFLAVVFKKQEISQQVVTRMQDLASEFSKIFRGWYPRTLTAGGGDPLPHPTPSLAFGWAWGASAPVCLHPGVGTQTLVVAPLPDL